MEFFIDDLATKYQSDRCHLLNMLWEVQRKFHYIPQRAIERLAFQLKTTQCDLEDTFTFYNFFHTHYAGKVQIYLDSSVTAAHQGQMDIQNVFEQELDIKLGEVSSQYDIGLFETPCIGMSDQGPACLINFIPFTEMTTKRALFIARQLKKGVAPEELVGQVSPKTKKKLFNGHEVTNKIFQKKILLGSYQFGLAFKKAKSIGSQEIITRLKTSGLRGRGGAGFPTWQKWDLCRSCKGERRFVICNADEGEPGTFKDRVLLTKRALMLFEGMAIAGLAIGASEGVIYLRAEYQYLLPKLERELKKFHQKNNFSLRIQLGAGAYVCGEETALLESLEGKRGEPRIRPPFPIERGYQGQPTIINNVETFCSVPRIIEKGAKAFLAFGTEKSTGTRLFSVAGDVLRPGVYEWPFGITIKQVLKEAKAFNPYALQIGGPSGVLIDARQSERRICFEDIPTGGAITIFSHERDLLQIIHSHLQFFVQESCGCCSPCRAGNVMLEEFLYMLRSGRAQVRHFEDLKKWAQIISQTSRCGLGQSSPNPIMTASKYFPEIFTDLLNPDSENGIHNFDIKWATTSYDQIFQKNESVP